MTVDGGLWLAAAAYGDTDPHTVGAPVFAHTTPVYVDVDGRRVGRAASARWCLRLLDGLEELAAEQGRFDPGTGAAARRPGRGAGPGPGVLSQRLLTEPGACAPRLAPWRG